MGKWRRRGLRHSELTAVVQGGYELETSLHNFTRYELGDIKTSVGFAERVVEARARIGVRM